MTRNNKMVLGVAAGVAALAVAGMYAKRKGYLNNINANTLKDKFSGLTDTAMKAFSGNSNSNNDMSASGSANSSSNESTSKRKSSSGMNTGNVGNINPATT